MNDSKHNKIKQIFDYLHRISFHHALWYRNAVELYGTEKASELLDSVYDKSGKLQMQRISKVLGSESDENNIPEILSNLSEETIDELKTTVAKNWLANDGIWFQTIEFNDNMQNAKKCNDEAWREFSPFEAVRIKSLLGLNERPGLDGLKLALKYRLYNDLNVQSIGNEKENSFDFFMNECRVQNARKRKGLVDYPCKSAGIIEYSTFAKTIDSRIKTKVIACPPDKHPDEWYCGWHFFIND